MPFIALLGLIDETKNKKLFGVIKSIVIWIFITPFFVFVIDALGDSMAIYYLNGLFQFLIGCFLINFYKFPRSFIFFALLFPVFSNLYFLIYGSIKNNINK